LLLGVVGTVQLLFSYCFATGLLEWVCGCFVCWRVGWGGAVLAVFHCRRVMFVGVVVVERGTGDVSAGGGVRLHP